MSRTVAIGRQGDNTLLVPLETEPTAQGRSFEAAVPAGEDPVRYARLLRQIREAALSGDRAPAAARPLVDDSWRRTLGFGMDPDRGREP